MSTKRIAKLYREKKILIDGKTPSAEELETVAHSLVRFRLPKRGTTVELYASHPALSTEPVLLRFKP